MQFFAALLLAIPAVILAGCVYDGAERKDKETWKNGGFEFKCIVLGEGTFTVEITGCVWARTGKVLQLGETVTENAKTAKCYKDSDVIRFEEKFEGKGMTCTENCSTGDKTTGTKTDTKKPEDKTGSDVSKTEGKGAGEPVENKCMFNGKSFAGGSEWRDGSFKYSCSTGDFGWKVEITACFWDEDVGGTGVEMKIGDETKSDKAMAKCYTENEVTYLNVTPIAMAKTPDTMAPTTDTKAATPTTDTKPMTPTKDTKPMTPTTDTKPMTHTTDTKPMTHTADSKPVAKTDATGSSKVDSEFSVDAKPDQASGYKATDKVDTSIKTVLDVTAPATGGVSHVNTASSKSSGDYGPKTKDVPPKPVETKEEPMRPVETKKTEPAKKTQAPCDSSAGCVEINAHLRSGEQKEMVGPSSKDQSPSAARPVSTKHETVGSSVHKAAKQDSATSTDSKQTVKKEESVLPVATGAENNVEIKCSPTDSPHAHGDTWKLNGFQYKCTVNENKWKVEVIACIWEKNGGKIIPVDSAPMTKDKLTATCKKGEDGMVYFEEKMTPST